MARAGSHIEVHGAKEFRAAMRRFDADVNDLKAVNREAAQVVDVRALELVPRRSNTLSHSIRIAARPSGASILAGSRLVPYAGPIHFGWRAHNIEPQPFLFDAIDDRRDEVVRVYEDRIDELVLKVGRETPP
jgi:hypothetical protein